MVVRIFFLLLTASLARAQPSKTYVIVHGAFGGGYAWQRVDALLTARGHRVYRPTLTGLGERAHLAAPSVNLSTHVNDIVNVLLFENLTDVVLVGHSYGGLVITGVADSLPGRVAEVVYIDAHIGADNKSAFDLRPGGDDLMKYAKDGLIAPPFVQASGTFPRNVPQPVATLTERRRLRRPYPSRGAYILTVEDPQRPEQDAFYFYEKIARMLGWRTHRLTADHNPQTSRPEELVRLIVD